MKKVLPYLILLFSCFSYTLYAQRTSPGIVKGIITDKATGEPLIGATVTLKNRNSGAKISSSVGLNGAYTFRNIASGDYEVEAKYVSYKDAQANVTVSGQEATVNLALSSKANDLNEVTIRGGRNAGSDQTARRVEQRSDQVLNAVSSRSIEVSPDITIANVTQRVSGVSVERSNNGEAQYAIIRGMDQRYQYTLIDGIKIPSPSNTNRYVPLDIFPADIVDRLEVYKSLTANMEGDAIGGAINLALKEAPDQFTLRLNAGTGYAENFFNGSGFTKFDHSASLSQSPRVSNPNAAATIANFPNNPLHYSNIKVPLATVLNLSIGGRSKDKKLGGLLAASYQNTYRQTNGIFFDDQVNLITNNPDPQSVQSRTYSIQQQRAAFVGKVDYRFNDRNKINLNGSYINLTQNEYRFTSDTSLQLGRQGLGTGRVNQDYRSDRTIQQIYNINLQGDHRITPEFRVNWIALYSKATANEPDRTDLNTNTGVTLANGSYDQGSYFFSNTAAQSRIFAKNSDQDKTGYLNLFYTPTIAGTVVEFSGGGMYRDKQRHSVYDEYDLLANAASNGAPQQFYGNIDNNSFYLPTGNSGGTGTNALNYDFIERTSAGYGQFKFTIGKLQTIGGLRYEHTYQNWLTATPSIAGRYGTIKYDDWLPDLNFKYRLDDRQALRLSYYSAISRPNFFELIPHVVGDPDADYQQYGNYNLRRTTAENFDLRYEFFPKGLDQLLAGVFYKNLNNPIEYALEKVGNNGGNYGLIPENFGQAHNYGFELDFTKYISKFGVRANYTFTDSRITTNKLVDYRDANGNVTNRTEQQTRPLQGQSKNIGNFSLLYRDANAGVDAQLSLVYTGTRINEVSPYLDNDVWQKAFTTLDFSAEKRIFKSFAVYVKATNLLNTPYELVIHRPYPTDGQQVEYQVPGKDTFVRRDTYRQYYLLGIRYRI